MLREELDELGGPRGSEITAYSFMDLTHGLLNSLSVHPNANVDILLVIDCFYFSDMNRLFMPVSSDEERHRRASIKST
jgi:hypothetical protein